MSSRDTRTIIRRALEDAISWNVSLAECLHESDPHLAETTRTLIADLKKVLERRYPPRPDPFENARLVPISEIAKKDPTP